MANYAFIENNEVQSVYDFLPENWRNISNFRALENDWNYLNLLGWFKLIKTPPDYNSNTHRIDIPYHYIENGQVYESFKIVELPPPAAPPPEPDPEYLKMIKWEEIRIQRNQMMNDFDWHYSRYEREKRLGVPSTDTLESLDTYMQALADITKQNDPFNIEWPYFIS